MNQQFESLGELQGMIGHLDHAELRPVNVLSNDIQSHVAVWNTSQDQLETIVERRNSNLIQHDEALSPFIEAINEKRTDVNGTLKNHGGEVIIEALFKDLYIGDGDNKIQMGVRLSNNYNSKSGPYFKGEVFGFRSFCTNGMILGKVVVGTVFSKHTKIADLQKKMMEFIGSIYDNAIKLENVIKEAEKDTLLDDEAEDILLRIFRRKKFVKKLQELFEKRSLTRYTVYNAITDYATHKAATEKQRVGLHQIAQRVLMTPKSKLMNFEED